MKDLTNQNEETFDELYTVPKKKAIVEEQKRPFSPPIKQHSKEKSDYLLIKSSQQQDQDDAPPFLQTRLENLQDEKISLDENPFVTTANSNNKPASNLFNKFYQKNDNNQMSRHSLISNGSDTRNLSHGRRIQEMQNTKSKQLIFDKQLKCYYDPHTTEYYEMVTKSK